MSILTEPLPVSVFVAGREIPIHWDHRTMLQIDELLAADMPEEERGAAVLRAFYGEIPELPEEAAQAMIWFFRCGKEPTPVIESAEEAALPRPDFAYLYDAELILAAFWDQYNLDLTQDTLHWWTFRALFDGLVGDHLFCEVRRCRSVKITNDMDKEHKRYYRAMKKLHALPRPDQEQKEMDELTAALLGDGNIAGLFAQDEEE